MKIKDITEGWGKVASNLGKDFFGVNRSQTWKQGLAPGLAKKQANQDQAEKTNAQHQQLSRELSATPDEEKVTDIKDTLDSGIQYRFANPDYPGTQIIVRNTGWYIDKLPQQLRGQIRRDKNTGLYPVLQPANIKKYNLYYNQAADAGKVKEEPAAAL